jgi:hypothetical protein
MTRPFKWPMAAGILVTIAFAVLLLIRLDFFQTQTPPVAGIKMVPPQQPQDIWMTIFQNDRKIGFVHRMLTKNENGFAFNENVFMEISTMGMPQALNLATEGQLNADMTLSSFTFKLNSSLFQFHIRGRVADNKLILYTGAPNRQQKNEMPLQALPHISGNIYDAAFHAGMDKGTTRGFSIFDPSSMSVRTINVTRNADEIIPIMGIAASEKILRRFYGRQTLRMAGQRRTGVKRNRHAGSFHGKNKPGKCAGGNRRQRRRGFYANCFHPLQCGNRRSGKTPQTSNQDQRDYPAAAASAPSRRR